MTKNDSLRSGKGQNRKDNGASEEASDIIIPVTSQVRSGKSVLPTEITVLRSGKGKNGRKRGQ